MINHDPGFYQARVNLGNTLMELGRVDKGLAVFADSHKRRHCPPTVSAAPSAVNRDEIMAKTTSFKLRHDIEQFHHLAARGVEPERFSALADSYQALLDRIDPEAALKVVSLPDDFRARHWRNYNRALHVADGAVTAVGSFNPALDTEALQQRYFDNDPKYVVVDDLLTEDAWWSLYDYCLNSTIWYDFRHSGYLGAYLDDGFAAPVLLDLAMRLPERFPRIFGDHKLLKVWGYKYDSTLSGIGVHADFAAVNVNLWLTPTEASTDPDGSGLRLFSVEAPAEWSFEDYNKNQQTIQNYIDDRPHEKIDVPYRRNRAVIFNSNLFHASGTAKFKDGYCERRINVTLLYGRRVGWN